jgi:hypothetical protein
MFSMRSSSLSLLCGIALASTAWADTSFVGACDGSAAVALDSSQFVSAFDEKNVLNVFAVAGGSAHTPLDLDAFLNVPPGSESDIEGGARLGADRIFWITSHGRNKKGKPRPERMRFFATRWDGSKLAISGTTRADLLLEALKDDAWNGLGLKTASEKAPEAPGGLNIEGLAEGPASSLLIGFRSPLFVRQAGLMALLLPLLNPGDVVDKNAAAEFGAPVFLFLGNRGVRSIDRLKDGSYRIIAGGTADTQDFALYTWSGKAGEQPVEAPANFADFHPESLIELAPGKLLALSDDGTDACKAAVPAQQSFRGRPIP